MAATQATTVVGVFKTRAEADSAVDDLLADGYSRDQIGVIAKNLDGKVTSQAPGDKGNTGEGAAIGAATGAGVAGLVSLGVSFGMIPAIGPILAVGPLAAALISAGAGAAAMGLAGALMGWGVPEEEANYYESEVKSGRYVVTVRDDERGDDTWKILNKRGAYKYGASGGSMGKSTSSR
jgi:hypothetical protein